ncbi:MAG: SO_0444 family Cu/Zn efflux transporter [Deltaproteobacteria bacterium]|nr:SO_0444 family Cu/Zn efflux transporter [Deltaproteobacteria bacterium]
MLDLAKRILLESWQVMLLASPLVLLGLLVAGLFHVLLSRRLVLAIMGRTGLGAVATAACFGIPLPICSCGIVPVSIELRNKGASRPAGLSFLITTPETSADAILLTWAMFGPIMTIARPLASFLTAMVAGIAAIAWPEDDSPPPAATPPDAPAPEPHVVGFGGFARSAGAFIADIWRKPLRSDGATVAAEDAAPEHTPFPQILRRVFRYGFVIMMDDIAFWLLVGILLAGAIGVAIPGDLAALGLGSGLPAMLIMLLAGVPIYMCASGSTPIAAALVAKGLSPGAALVFLLSGPATNAATIVLLTRHFGRRFVSTYLGSIVATSLAAGLALDYFLGLTGWNITAKLAASGEGVVGYLQWVSAIVLLGLCLWRLKAGALRQGLREFLGNIEGFFGGTEDAAANERRAFWQRRRRAFVGGGLALAALAYLASGFYTVPPDSTAFEFRFGKLVRRDIPPGLHYAPPAPVGRADVWRTRYPRKTDVGFRTDLFLLENRKQLLQSNAPGQWHSAIAAMNRNEAESSYIAGDENLVDVSFTVHYSLADPYAFFYGVGKANDIVSLYAQAAAREYVARSRLDDLVTEDRPGLEKFVAGDLQKRLDAAGAGVRVDSVHVVDVHPPQDAVFAFRDVSSAREDRETRIHQAHETLAREVPLARGQGEKTVAAASAEADGARTVAAGRSQGFSAQSDAFAVAPDLLSHLLKIETAESVLPGREKFVVPPGTAGRGVVLWKDANVPIPPKGDQTP